MREYKEFKELCEAKRGLYANIHAKRRRGEAPAKPGSKDYPAKDAFKKAARTAKEEFELATEAAWTERKVRKSLEVLTRKEGNLTKEKILEATLKHQARRLEIPVAHRFALE